VNLVCANSSILNSKKALTMPIHVQLSPLIRKYVADYDHSTGIRLTVDAPYRVEQIIARLSIPREEVISIMVNGYPAKYNSTVNDGDSVTLAKVIGGG
jgi:sulfur carrier protein ThiS